MVMIVIAVSRIVPSSTNVQHLPRYLIKKQAHVSKRDVS